MNEFDKKWESVENRMKIVPGKEVLSALNAHLQLKYKIALSPIFVVASFLRGEISPQIAALLCKLDEIRKEETPDQAALEFAQAVPDQVLAEEVHTDHIPDFSRWKNRAPLKPPSFGRKKICAPPFRRRRREEAPSEKRKAASGKSENNLSLLRSAATGHRCKTLRLQASRLS